MNRRQSQKNNMYKKVLAFFTENGPLFAGFRRLTDEIKRFVNLNNTLDERLQQQQLRSEGVTDEKALLYLQIAGSTVRTSRKALVYAKDQKDAVLMDLFDIRDSELIDEDVSVELARIKNIVENLIL